MNKEQLRQLLQELLAETACPIKSVKLPAVSEALFVEKTLFRHQKDVISNKKYQNLKNPV